MRVEVAAAGHRWTTNALDVSFGGVRLELVSSLLPGDALTVTLPFDDLAVIPATVVRTDEASIALRFEEIPLDHARALARWLASRPAMAEA